MQALLSKNNQSKPPLRFERALPKRLHDHIVDDLGMRIVRGDYLPDEALPTEDLLVEALGVSRTVVREAIKVLAKKNLLEVRTRTGTKVCAADKWNQLDPDILRWRFSGEFDEKLVRDLIDLRQIIEPAAAELAATRATKKQLIKLQATWALMSADSAVEEHIKADLAFHVGILEATNNDLLQGLRDSLVGALNFAIHFSTRSKKDGISSLELHEAVLQAIVSRDPAGARKSMAAIVSRWADDSLKIIKSRK
jgi:DNA-binding FadR family transcriptional regulator